MEAVETASRGEYENLDKPNPKRKRIWAALILGLLFVGGVVGVIFAVTYHKNNTSSPSDIWINWGSGYTNSRYNPKSKITPKNIDQLKLQWAINLGGSFRQPIIDENYIMYFSNGINMYALNSLTGQIVWIRNHTASNTPTLWNDYLLAGAGNGTVFAINRTNGNSIWTTPPLQTPSNAHQSGVVTSAGIYIIGWTGPESPGTNFRGQVSGLNATIGEYLWTTYTVPNGTYGASVWGSSPPVDEDLNMVFIATGNNFMIPLSVQQCLNNLTQDQLPYLCQDPQNLVDSIVALNISSGQIIWNFSTFGVDWWSSGCFNENRLVIIDPRYCSPNPYLPGYDWDFAQAPMLFENSQGDRLVGAGSKGGVFFTLDRLTGRLIWSQSIVPGSDLGGMLLGSATDGKRIYVAGANGRLQNWTLANGTKLCYGAWMALDIDSGAFVWQTPDPKHMSFEECASWNYTVRSLQNTPNSWAPVTAGNGLNFAEAAYGNLYAMDQLTGQVLWTHATNLNFSRDGVCLVNNWLYWPISNGTIYAFSV